MQYNEIQDKNRTILITEDICEKVNPIEHYHKYFYEKTKLLMSFTPEVQELLQIQNGVTFVLNFCKEQADNDIKEILEHKVPSNLMNLLGCKKKNTQLNFLKNVKISAKDLGGFILQAYDKKHYIYSNYIFQKLPKSVEENKMPTLIEKKKDGSIDKIGETEYSDAKLSQILDHTKKIVAKFIEKGDEWHCFFVTYDSLKGKESWNNNTPHYHYISSAFGISREALLKQLERGEHPTSPVHIELTTDIR